MKSAAELASPGILIDRSKIDGLGFAMSGALEAMTMMLGMLQEIYISLPDPRDRKIISAIMEPLEERADQLSNEINIYAEKRGAIRRVGN